MVEAVLWDNDGVLVDTEGMFYEANRLTLERLGISLRIEDFAGQFVTLGVPVQVDRAGSAAPDRGSWVRGSGKLGIRSIPFGK